MTQLVSDAGFAVIELPAEERAKLVDAGKKFLDEWVSTADGLGLPGEKLLADYQTLIAKYTDERDASGYPWASKTN